MSFEIWIAFSLATIVLLIIPGPTILTVISFSLSHGNKAKIPLILAVALGDSTALALSLLGLGVLLSESAFCFQMIKWAGGLYLIYLGSKLLLSEFSALRILPGSAEQRSSLALFINTYLVTALNPKGIIFFVAFLPQFINTSQAVAPQLWLLASTFVILATLNATAYSAFAGKAKSLISSPKASRVFNIFGGSLMCFAGLWALSVRRV